MLSAANRAVALGAAADDKATQAALDSDNPRWITEDTTDGALTRNIESASGDLATTKTGDTILQLTNIHGDNCTPALAGHQQGPRCLGLRRVRQPAGRPGRYPLQLARRQTTLHRDPPSRRTAPGPAAKPPATACRTTARRLAQQRRPHLTAQLTALKRRHHDEVQAPRQAIETAQSENPELRRRLGPRHTAHPETS